MLTVTDQALKHLSNLLEEREAADDVVVRCIVDGENLALVPDAEQPGDEVFKLEDRAVLVVAHELAKALDGREFDLHTTEEGSGLTLR
jgi:Fe-S cluster assembly iron-binding protein IscA